MHTRLRFAQATVVVIVALLIVGLFAQPSAAQCQNCTLCINGVCYQPPPAPLTYPTFIFIGGVCVGIPGGGPQVLASPGEGYPAVPVWVTCTCPTPFPIVLYGSPGIPPPAPPYPLPGQPTSNPPTPPTCPPHQYWCYSHAVSPFPPPPSPGGGAPAPLPPTPPTGTPSRPTSSPTAPNPPAPQPPVPFGPNASGIDDILNRSGCYIKVNCGNPPTQSPAGTIIVFVVKCPGRAPYISHACISNGDGTANSKNGTTPHTPNITWEELLAIYAPGGPGGPQCAHGTVEAYCYKRVC